MITDSVLRAAHTSRRVVQRLVLEYHEVDGQTWAQLRDWFGSVGLHVVRQKPVNDALGTAWLSRGAVAG